jgi:hypothetical protein
VTGVRSRLAVMGMLLLPESVDAARSCRSRFEREAGDTWPACMCHARNQAEQVQRSTGPAQPGTYGCTCSVRHEWLRSAGSGTRFGPIPRAMDVVGRSSPGMFSGAAPPRPTLSQAWASLDGFRAGLAFRTAAHRRDFNRLQLTASSSGHSALGQRSDRIRLRRCGVPVCLELRRRLE